MEKGSDAVKTILTRENCDSIIQGISRLEWLLSLPKEQPIFSEYFRDNFYADRNPLIAYLLQMTAHVGGVKYDQIKRDLVNKGTEREQALIAELTKECERYLAHLETAQPLNIQEESRGYKKWSLKNTTTKDLKKILTDSNDSAFEKIKNFHTMFLDNKAALSQHRDSPTQLFLKRAAYILSSLFLGAGFIYSYVTNGTCNFFKSKGELMTDKIQSYLPNTSAPSH